MDRELRLVDLIGVETLQRIQNAFSRMTGMAALTTDAEGVPVTEGSNFSEFCFDYTRKSESGCMKCEKCDKYGAELALKNGKSITYFCHAGLVDFAAPIMADGKMVGCFIGGQVLTEAPKEEKVREIAELIGVDPEKYVAAARKVAIVPQEKIERSAEFLYTIAAVISEIAYSRYQADRAGEEIEKAANLKSDFLANMSHEIRTPMNAVLGMAEMALRENLPERAREYVTEIQTSAKSLLTIINDILDFSKIESGKMDILPVEYEPMSIINDITSIVLTRLGDKKVEFILDVDPELPYKLWGDNDRIKQIILNLVNNAIKFTREGQVVLKVGFSKKSEEEILLKVSVEDTGIGIKKEDLSKLFQSFRQLDSKRNRNIEGTGLGLAICKQLLALMDGSIAVESEYEKGSIFSFELPQKVLDAKASIFVKNNAELMVAGMISNPFVGKQLEAAAVRLGAGYISLEGEEELEGLLSRGVTHLFVEAHYFVGKVKRFVEETPQLTAVLVSSQKEIVSDVLPNVRVLRKPVYELNIAMVFNNENIRCSYNGPKEGMFDFIAPEAEILIVDDNEVNLKVAEGLLEPLKMKIDTAVSGQEAISKVTFKRYDLIFMDHMMPELDGVETTHIIRRFHPEYGNVPIIALTANAVEGTMEMFLKEGMNDFVAKPIEIRVLISKVKKWLPVKKIQKNVMWEETVAVEELRELPVVADLDVRTALGLLGSEKLFWSVLRDYYRVIEQKAALIKTYEEAENWMAYTIEVHALKSASRQIGANELGELAAELEKAGHERNKALIREKTGELLKKYRFYGEALQPFFVETQPKDEAEKPFITAELLLEYFEALRLAMDDLDMDGMEGVMEEMKQYRYEEAAGKLFVELQAAVENIDIDACTGLLECWEAMY